jgi:hypothetical protein
MVARLEPIAIKKCEWCEWMFAPTNLHGPIPKYCSKSHRQRAYEARVKARGTGQSNAS